MKPGQLLHSALTCTPSVNEQHPKSRHPFVPAAHELISSSDNNNRNAALWADHQWNAEWLENTAWLRTFISDTGTQTPGMTLTRTERVRRNRLRTALGRCRSCLLTWVMAPSAAYECGAEEQTFDHVVLHFSIHRPTHGLHGLTALDNKTIEWLLNTCPEIW